MTPGANWEALGLAETRRIARVAIDPADPQKLFVRRWVRNSRPAPDRGLYRSVDGGASWTRAPFVNASTGACDVVVNPVHPETVFCATWNGCGGRNTGTPITAPAAASGEARDHARRGRGSRAACPRPPTPWAARASAIAPSQPRTMYAQIMAKDGSGRGLPLHRRRPVVDPPRPAGSRELRRVLGWYSATAWWRPTIPIACTRSRRSGAALPPTAAARSTRSRTTFIRTSTRCSCPRSGRTACSSATTADCSGPPTPASRGRRRPACRSRSSTPARSIRRILRILGGARQDNGTVMTGIHRHPRRLEPDLRAATVLRLVDPVNPLVMPAEYQNASSWHRSATVHGRRRRVLESHRHQRRRPVQLEHAVRDGSVEPQRDAHREPAGLPQPEQRRELFDHQPRDLTTNPVTLGFTARSPRSRSRPPT